MICDYYQSFQAISPIFGHLSIETAVEGYIRGTEVANAQLLELLLLLLESKWSRILRSYP